MQLKSEGMKTSCCQCMGVLEESCCSCLRGHSTLSHVWIKWRERNHRTFEGIEHSVLELKLFLLLFMYWMAASSSHSFSSLEKFIDLCNL